MGLKKAPETNIAPENKPSQKATSIPPVHFQVRTISFREGICLAFSATVAWSEVDRCKIWGW